jgi:hypothetical protein
MRNLEAMDKIWLALLIASVGMFIWTLSENIADGETALNIVLNVYSWPILICTTLSTLVPKGMRASMIVLMCAYLSGVLLFEAVVMPITFSNLSDLDHKVWSQFAVLVTILLVATLIKIVTYRQSKAVS